MYRMALLPMPAGGGVPKQIGPYSRGGLWVPAMKTCSPPLRGVLWVSCPAVATGQELRL